MIWKANFVVVIAAFLGVLAFCGPVLGSDANLVAHWSFDEGSGTTAYDLVGGNDGALVGGPNWTAGVIGGGLSFDGINDSVGVGDPPDGSLDFGTSDFTLSVWFRTSAAPGFFVCKRAKGFYAGYDFYIQHEGKIFARIADGGSVPDARTAAGFNDGFWHHAAAVYDRDGVIRIYVDGVSEAISIGISSIGSVNNNEPFTIGDRNDPGHHSYFNGSIDEVMIFNRALSGEEIQRLYWDGIGDLELAIMQIEDSLSEKEAALEVIDAALEKELVSLAALDDLLGSGEYGDLKKGDVIKAQQKIHSAMQHQGQSADALEKAVEKLEDALEALGWEPEPEPNEPEPEPNDPEPDPNLVAYWRLDEGSGSAAFDSAGSNHGSLVGDTAWTSGQVAGALVFDGSGDYVDCGNGASINDLSTFSVAMWFKVDGFGAYAPHLICQRDLSSWVWTFLFHSDYGQRLTARIETTGIPAVGRSNFIPQAGIWYHTAMTYNDAGDRTVRVYVDGVEQTYMFRTAGSGMKLSNPSIHIAIANRIGGGRDFGGSIDEVMIFNRVLSAGEVQVLYEQGL